jgi:Ca2+-binding EF-hand superfamily protein
MIRTLFCSAALIMAGPALAQTAAPGGATPEAGAAATPEQPAAQAQQTVDVAAVVNSEFPSYDADKSGELSQAEFSTWMTTLKKAEIATTGQKLADNEITAWAGAAFAVADKDKSTNVSKTELVTYLGG